MPITGGGGGGGDTYTTYSSQYYAYFTVGPVGDGDFVATIATLPTGSSLTYNAPSAGDEDFLTYVDGLNQIGRLVLHNTTRGNSAQVLLANVAINSILTADPYPGDWAVGDTITLRSQTCDIGGSPYYFDLYVGDAVPEEATVLYVVFGYRTTVAQASLALHPYEVYGAAKSVGVNNYVANIVHTFFFPIPLTDQTFCFRLNTVGANQCNALWLKIWGWELPA